MSQPKFSAIVTQDMASVLVYCHKPVDTSTSRALGRNTSLNVCAKTSHDALSASPSLASFDSPSVYTQLHVINSFSALSCSLCMC